MKGVCHHGPHLILALFVSLFTYLHLFIYFGKKFSNALVQGGKAVFHCAHQSTSDFVAVSSNTALGSGAPECFPLILDLRHNECNPGSPVLSKHRRANAILSGSFCSVPSFFMCWLAYISFFKSTFKDQRVRY